MRRLIAPIAASLALVGAGAAEAKVRHLTGNVEGGGTVRVKVTTKRGAAGQPPTVTVRDVIFTAVPVECDQGPTTLITGVSGNQRPVGKRGKFSFAYPGSPWSAHGKVKDGGRGGDRRVPMVGGRRRISRFHELHHGRSAQVLRADLSYGPNDPPPLGG